MKPSTNPELLEALAVTIKARRQELEISQEDLAGRCEIDRPYISLIELARKQPTVSVLWKIASGLEWKLSELATHLEEQYDHQQRMRRRTTSGSGTSKR